MSRAGLFIVFLFVASAAQATQIYLCKTNQGAEYLAQNWCNSIGGYTFDAVTVPDGMPFKEQQRLADKLRAEKRSAQVQDDKARDKASACRAIDDQLAQIWKRYDNRLFNEAAMIEKDQTRTRELKSKRRQMGC